MEPKTYGYIRVSTKEQNEDRQRLSMAEFGIAEEYIVMDKQSGKDFNRPGYQALIEKMKPGDTLVVKSIDRLGRNYADILEQWRKLTAEKKIDIVVIDNPLLDTRNKKDLVGVVVSDIVLQLLSYMAETERSNIRQRQAEGIAAAKDRGQKFGRPRLERPTGFESMREEYLAGNLSSRHAAQKLGISHMSFINWIRS